MLDIIGAPFDLCGLRLGSRLGPAALRLADLQPTLGTLGLETRDLGDVSVLPDETEEEGMRNFPPLVDCVSRLRTKVGASLREGNVPIVLGGDHALAMGGISAALQHFGDGLAVLWIDAHADINTPGTSESGNLHGMPLAALMGMASGSEGVRDAEWTRLLEAVGPRRLLPEHALWYGLRDVDAAERPRLKGLSVTMHDVDRHGIVTTVHSIDRYLRTVGATHLWISFDVDVLDPFLAPGTGTAVRGGLTYREAHLCAELLRETLDVTDCPYELVGLDVVETNPLVDSHNQTAKMAVEWVASLFGKTVLGP